MPAVEYSTNKTVTNYYQASSAKWFRDSHKHEFNEFVSKLMAGDTVTIGIDYYAFYNKIVPAGLTKTYYNELISGKVLAFKTWHDSTGFVLQQVSSSVRSSGFSLRKGERL